MLTSSHNIIVNFDGAQRPGRLGHADAWGKTGMLAFKPVRRCPATVVPILDQNSADQDLDLKLEMGKARKPTLEVSSCHLRGMGVGYSQPLPARWRVFYLLGKVAAAVALLNQMATFAEASVSSKLE